MTKEPTTSPGLRLTLALLMMDACTGKICSLQRVGSFSGQSRLCESGSRFMNGPLGASYGGDNGSALLLTVSDATYPAANAVNDGARRGMRLLKDSCTAGTYCQTSIVRVAKFGSKLWRTINGERLVFALKIVAYDLPWFRCGNGYGLRHAINFCGPSRGLPWKEHLSILPWGSIM